LQIVARCGQRIGFILGLGACALTARAEAQEYCVACTEPPAVYRCVIDGARPGGRYPLQRLCVVAMTKEGRHGACGVRGGTVFECSGPVKRVPWAAYNAAAGPVPAAPRPAAPPPAAQAPNGPPRTVEEVVKRANEKTAEQIKETDGTTKKQADTLSEATKKTWQCLSSLFTRCGSE
jgi:hypothetical protein